MAAWLAILAMSLNALWPLIAQAKPSAVTLVPVCTVGGETHYVEVETGKPGADAVHLEHCQLCPLGVAALPSGSDGLVLTRQFTPAFPDEKIELLAIRPLLDGRPRAPPFSLLVAFHTDKHWRTHEEDSALRLRGARDADAGRGIVRRVVLLR
jgi:hypothetical protein